MEILESFKYEQVRKLRQAAKRARRMLDWDADGWFKSPVDPMNLVRVFNSLHVKLGYELRAYLYRSGGNGHGLVFGMIKDSPFPEPILRPGRKYSHLPPQLPEGTIEDVTEIIEGDFSAWSYFSGSIFKREIQEFGALWHGKDWSTHTILCTDPWDIEKDVKKIDILTHPSPNDKEWDWIDDKPNDWKPCTLRDKEQLVVQFYSYSALGRQTIYKHTDTFVPVTYQFIKNTTVIAKGPAGFMF